MTVKNTFIHIVFSIYLGLVCLISGIAFCVSIASIGQDSVVYNFPQLGAYNDYHYYHGSTNPAELKMTDEELALKKEKDLERTQWNALRGIVDSLTTLLVSFIVFVFHWKLFRKNHERVS